MNLTPQRGWITPLTIGSFALTSVTGILMFFHLDMGLNKVAHEWLSWVLVAAVALHGLLNWPAFKRYFSQRLAVAVMGVSAAVLALSFTPLGGRDAPPFKAPISALARAPLTQLAVIAQTDVVTVRQRLVEAEFDVRAETPSIAALTGADLRQQIRALNAVLTPPGT